MVMSTGALIWFFICMFVCLSGGIIMIYYLGSCPSSLGPYMYPGYMHNVAERMKNDFEERVEKEVEHRLRCRYATMNRGSIYGVSRDSTLGKNLIQDGYIVWEDEKDTKE